MAAALSQERMAAAVILSTARAPATVEASAWALDTSAQTPTQGSAARRRRLSCRPLPQSAAINGKMAAAALARIRAVGLGARRLVSEVQRQLSLAFNYVSSYSAPGGTKLVEWPCKRSFR